MGLTRSLFFYQWEYGYSFFLAIALLASGLNRTFFCRELEQLAGEREEAN
jgi:hypothetical protein